jgi:methylmalonyl-CoA mutase, N-terminal domain
MSARLKAGADAAGAATPSGIEVPVVASRELASDPGAPGVYPFTRGIFADGYRGRPWTIRQYSGFGSAEASNQRYRFLLEQGQTGLSVALDLPTQCGYDPDDPMARPEVGKVGVSLFSLSEMETLFEGIDLGAISTSFTINGTAAIIYAMYLAAADKQGVPRAKLTGTIQNDILKEYVARGTWIFPVRPSMRLIADSVLYANEATPRFNAISIAGAHVRDAGCTAVEEMAYTLANGLAYVDELIRRGGDVAKFARRLSFFFYVHMDLFEEACKFRAGRRLWAKLLRSRYGVTDEKALHFRFGVVCGGSSLVAAQPYNNIVRVAIENLAAVLGGAQSIFTCAYDEAFQIPTEFSAELALRTQQIVQHESGVAATVDPLGGSYYVEWLTDRMEEGMRGVMDEIDT